MKATFIRDVSGKFTGQARLYEVSPAREYGYENGYKTHFVVASATVAPYSGPETYLFPADAGGTVLDWMELPGSLRGHLDCDEAMRNAGYEVSS